MDGNYARRACCDVVNRGVQVWEGKVYVGTLDGYLVCLDAATGILIWKADTFIDRTAFYTITGPPQIAKGKLVIGNSGAEFGVRGYISAFDLETVKFAWRFFMVPGDPKNKFEHPEMKVAIQPGIPILIGRQAGVERLGANSPMIHFLIFCTWEPVMLVLIPSGIAAKKVMIIFFLLPF